MATPVSAFWKCHTEDCPRERQGYSWWCVLHRDSGAHAPLTPCPCHGDYPPGMHHTDMRSQLDTRLATMVIRERISIRWRTLRVAHGATPAAVARALDISLATYTAYENGRRTPTLWFCQLVADYFGVPVARLVEKHEEQVLNR